MEHNNLIKNILNNYHVKLIPIKNASFPVINANVKKIFVINLIDNVIRRNYILLLLKKFKINATLVIVKKITNDIYHSIRNTNITKSELGCCLSHLWCLNQIIEKKYENAIIFEDDIILHKNFSNLFIETINKKQFDFLLLGACDYHFSELNYKNVQNNLYYPHKDSIKLYGAHANYYSYLGAKKLFDYKTSNVSFFDRDYLYMFMTFPNSSNICYPNLVVSDITTSDINHNHDLLSIQEKKYYNKCFINFDFNDYHFIYLNLLIKYKNKNTQKYENYNDYLDSILNEEYYNDLESFLIIKKRLESDFFTIRDIKLMILTS